jgi:hypothetical protein
MSIPSDMSPIEWWPAATIEPSADGTWQPTPEQPDPSAIEAMLYQLQELDGSLYDVVAWQATRPEIWWLRYGRATFMGEWCLAAANRDRKPVRLVTTPAEYLRLEPMACCILRRDSDVRSILVQAQYGWFCTNPALARWAQEAASGCGTVNVSLVA